jgi:methyl-CpG-binding domain protein 4
MLRACATSPRELQEVEEMLRLILKEAQEGSEEWIDAGTFQATLLLQQEQESDENQVIISRLLQDRGFSYRLSRQALIQSHNVPTAAPLPYANAWDNVLPQLLFEKLSHAFSTDSSFWTLHNYSDGSSQGRPPSPYFSYVVPLHDTSSSVLMQVLFILQKHVSTLFPQVKDCSAAEWWCHCRPHASGLQLHFDSDDEGRGGVRNPVCSTVLSLTEGIGGETLVTTQTSTSTTLCETGWLCQGQRNRLLAFKGNLLHGVVPGGTCDVSHKAARRITFMVAFWKTIRVQDEPGAGSARPFSRVQNEEWATLLMEESLAYDKTVTTAQNCFFQVPVWHDVDEHENKRQKESLQHVRKHKLLPPYDAFFQFYT